MGKALCEASSAARAVFAEADDVLGFQLSRLCFEGPKDELTLTANAQPAILATSIAALRVLEERLGERLGEGPAAVAGHSLGEYSALVAAGALRLGDALRLVHLRGKFMQEAVPFGTGSMAAILGLGAEDVAAVCLEVAGEQIVSPANLNGGGQIVIAGHKEAVDRACTALKAKGAKRAIVLPVSAPFHCALMRPAAERLQAELGRVEVSSPNVPVVTNVEATPCREASRIRELLTRQVTAPVQWEESVRCLVGLGIQAVVEVGPGNVLTGLVRRVAPEVVAHPTGNPDGIAGFVEAWTGASSSAETAAASKGGQSNG
jgi:[acyl-carrier-protein] S-malonyltransferase